MFETVEFFVNQVHETLIPSNRGLDPLGSFND